MTEKEDLQRKQQTAQSGNPPHAHSETEECKPAPLSFLEKKERKNLSASSQWEEDKSQLESLTEEDIKFHWPKLAAFGFRTDQIRQNYPTS